MYFHRAYWSVDEDLGSDLVKQAMSRNRFMKIKENIHFVDNDTVQSFKDQRDFKVKSLFDIINTNFKQFGIFSQHLSIDEMIVKYYGKHSLKQFIRGKPIRFGYKLWAICTSDGYCLQFHLYSGKEPSAPSQTAKEGLGSRVVKRLLEIVEDGNSHEVYFDNFFTSHQLLCDLKGAGFRATGKVREN